MKKAKPYSQPDPTVENVSEPVAVYVNAREAILKMEAVEAIMGLQGEELLDKALRICVLLVIRFQYVLNWKKRRLIWYMNLLLTV